MTRPTLGRTFKRQLVPDSEVEEYKRLANWAQPLETLQTLSSVLRAAPWRAQGPVAACTAKLRQGIEAAPLRRAQSVARMVVGPWSRQWQLFQPIPFRTLPLPTPFFALAHQPHRGAPSPAVLPHQLPVEAPWPRRDQSLQWAVLLHQDSSGLILKVVKVAPWQRARVLQEPRAAPWRQLRRRTSSGEAPWPRNGSRAEPLRRRRQSSSEEAPSGASEVYSG